MLLFQVCDLVNAWLPRDNSPGCDCIIQRVLGLVRRPMWCRWDGKTTQGGTHAPPKPLRTLVGRYLSLCPDGRNCNRTATILEGPSCRNVDGGVDLQYSA